MEDLHIKHPTWGRELCHRITLLSTPYTPYIYAAPDRPRSSTTVSRQSCIQYGSPMECLGTPFTLRPMSETVGGAPSGCRSRRFASPESVHFDTRERHGALLLQNGSHMVVLELLSSYMFSVCPGWNCCSQGCERAGQETIRCFVEPRTENVY